jgi:isopentenyl-diphosphate Delta-isomerase
MPGKDQTASRKQEHIQINLEQDVTSSIHSGLDRYRFIHQALPECNFTDIDLSQRIFNKIIQSPILISSMTGGTQEAQQINQNLAIAAQQSGIPMGLGSQRAAIEDPTLAKTFIVRNVAPDILLFANLGAVQLNYRYGINECIQAVRMVDADALILHLNPLQEALQPEGDTNFHGLLRKIEAVVKAIRMPVIVKEVGWGISSQSAKMLEEVGVAAIDVAGAGGTSWSQVEMFRMQDAVRARVAGAFRGWGIPTADSILMVKSAAPGMPIFASGGLRDGMDIAKAITMGARLGGMAGPFLKAAVQSSDKVLELIQETSLIIQIAMFNVGVTSVEMLHDHQNDILIKAGYE